MTPLGRQASQSTGATELSLRLGKKKKCRVCSCDVSQISSPMRRCEEAVGGSRKQHNSSSWRKTAELHVKRRCIFSQQCLVYRLPIAHTQLNPEATEPRVVSPGNETGQGTAFLSAQNRSISPRQPRMALSLSPEPCFPRFCTKGHRYKIVFVRPPPGVMGGCGSKQKVIGLGSLVARAPSRAPRDGKWVALYWHSRNPFGTCLSSPQSPRKTTERGPL